MDLKEWFANRKQRREQQENIKLPLETEDYCALWKNCVQCQEMLYARDFRENLQVCPKCNYHFRIGAFDRVEQLLDNGTFVELDSDMVSTDPLKFFDTEPYKKRQEDASRKSGLKEAVITGTGQIDGQSVALGAMDFGHFGGSMGSVVGEKVTRLAEVALDKMIPLIIISSSGGARMQEGILSLMQMAKTSSALKSYAEAGGLYISILAEPTYGGVTASFAMLGDIIMAEPGARVGFAGRRVIEDTVRQKLPADFQTAEYLYKHGQVDLLVERKKMKETLSRLIAIHHIGGGKDNGASKNGKKQDKVSAKSGK